MTDDGVFVCCRGPTAQPESCLVEWTNGTTRFRETGRFGRLKWALDSTVTQSVSRCGWRPLIAPHAKRLVLSKVGTFRRFWHCWGAPVQCTDSQGSRREQGGNGTLRSVCKGVTRSAVFCFDNSSHSNEVRGIYGVKSPILMQILALSASSVSTWRPW